MPTAAKVVDAKPLAPTARQLPSTGTRKPLSAGLPLHRSIMTNRIAIAGASGRMGQMLIEAVRASDDCLLTGALDVASSPALGADASAFLGHQSGVAITADLHCGPCQRPGSD